MQSVNASGTNCSTNGECIVYDALGRAVEIDAGTATEIWYTQVGKTAYMTGSTFNYAYFPAPGGGTYLRTGTGGNVTFNYMHPDYLGHARIVSSVTGQNVVSDRAYAPYGEVYNIFGSTQQNMTMFTGDTEDILAGMSDTPNRELQRSQQGRWLSPDPAGSGWNQYAYATNPNSFIDPSGLTPYLYAPPLPSDGVQLGNDEFDGIASAPGAYSGFDMYGNFTWGSSVDQWKSYFASLSVDVAQAVETQQEALTDAISNASTSPDGSNWDAIYASLGWKGDINGGHADFSWNWKGDPNGDPDPIGDFFSTLAADQLANGGCEWSCRYGGLDAIHYNNNMFHLDTIGANWGFGLGLFLHGLIDFGFGNINPGIPMVFTP